MYTRYTQSMTTALTEHLLEYLSIDEPPHAVNNDTTLLHQAAASQEWLLTKYLATWLELLGELVQCDYPLARSNAINLRAVSRLREYLEPTAGAERLSFILETIDRNLRQLALYTKVPQDRAMQWGIWARDVPMSIAYAFAERPFLDSSLCKEIASCCMYGAFVVSQIVTDSGAADEIEDRMFEEMPRDLLGLMQSTPPAPEA